MQPAQYQVTPKALTDGQMAPLLVDSKGRLMLGAEITVATFIADTPMKARKLVGGNLVNNGNFEYAPPFTAIQTTSGNWVDGSAVGSTTNSIFGWGATIGVGGSLRYDSSQFNSGGGSMKVSTNSALVNALNIRSTGTQSVIKQQSIPVLPNTSYTLTGYIKTNYTSGSVTRGAFLRAEEFDGSGTSTALSHDTTYINGSTTPWTQYSVTFTTSANARYIVIYCRNDGTTGGSANLIMDAWFDDIVLTPTTHEARIAVT